MKFLTIRQPWASLVAVGAKTIETRPFSTQYRGPLAIHAGKVRPVDGLTLGAWSVAGFDDWLCRWHPGSLALQERHAMPLGAVVAVCDLVDVVPIVAGGDLPDPPCRHLRVAAPGNGPRLATVDYEGRINLGGLGRPRSWGLPLPCSDQEPFGDFTPGRYAWLLSNVRPIDPVPMKGAQGLRDVPADIAERIAG